MAFCAPSEPCVNSNAVRAVHAARHSAQPIQRTQDDEAQQGSLDGVPIQWLQEQTATAVELLAALSPAGAGDERVLEKLGDALGQHHDLHQLALALRRTPGPQRDALLAGNTLADRARAEVGRDYARSWHRNFKLRIRLAATFAHLAMRPDASSIGCARTTAGRPVVRLS